MWVDDGSQEVDAVGLFEQLRTGYVYHRPVTRSLGRAPVDRSTKSKWPGCARRGQNKAARGKRGIQEPAIKGCL